jgi:hypothetical protein
MKTSDVHFRSLCALLGVGLLLWMAQPCYAVVGNVSVISAGEPVAGATISLQTPDGQTVAEEKSDHRGKAILLIPDNHKKKRLILITSKDGRTTRQNVDVGEGDTLTLVVDLPAAAPKPPTDGDGFHWALVITGFYKWANFDGSHDYVTGGLSGSGSLDGSSLGIGADVQVQPPSDWLHGLPLFFVLGFGYPFDIDESGARANYHPTPGLDAWLQVQENWFARLLVAWRLMSIRDAQLALLGGVQLTDVDAQFNVDETGGMGIINRFKESKTMASPVIGVGLTYPLGRTPAQLVANCYVTWLGDVSGSGQSTLGFLYDYSVDGGVQTELQVGVRIPIR